MTVAQLRDLLQWQHLKLLGKKEELVERLLKGTKQGEAFGAEASPAQSLWHARYLRHCLSRLRPVAGTTG